MIKAEAIAKLTDAIVLADDSGLEIDYLNKEPGIYSARYAGTDTSYEIKNNLLLQRLEGVPDEKRTARFVCAIAAVFPDGSKETVRGTIEGGSDMRLPENMDLDMIRFFIFQNTDVQLQNWTRKRRMNLATGERHSA